MKIIMKNNERRKPMKRKMKKMIMKMNNE